MIPTVFASFFCPHITPGTTEQLEDSWDSDAGEGQGLLCVSVSRAAHGELRRDVWVLRSLWNQMPGTRSRVGQRSGGLSGKKKKIEKKG